MRTFIVPFYAYLNKKIKNSLNVPGLMAPGTLPFLDQEEFGGKLIALDNRKSKLVYLKKLSYKPSCLIVDLKDLESCTIHKQYTSINAGDLMKRKLHEFLKSIYLNLHFRNSTDKVSIPFFEIQNDKQDDIKHLEAKAMKWRSIVSKILPSTLGKRA